MSKQTRHEQFMSTIKSTEIMDWEDLHVMRKLCFYLALFLNKLDINPNTVTIWSMVLGAGSAYFFASGSFYYNGWEGLLYNIIAVAMLYVADVCDNTDGQLARLSGKHSKIGRILDGMAGFVWFVPIYLALAWRMYQHHDVEFSFLGIPNNETTSIVYGIIVLVMVFYAGFACNSGQQRMSDYYVQVHLFFQKGEGGTEFDNAAQQADELAKMTKENSSWFERLFMKNYVGYTQMQEKETPEFQRFLKVANQKYGGASLIPAEIRKLMHAGSLSCMWLNHLVAFKYRAMSLALFVILDVPLLHFLFEIIVLGYLTHLMIKRHEAFCKECTAKL